MEDNISSILQDNMNTIRDIFKHSSDIVYTDFESYSGVKAIIIYIDGVVEKDSLNQDVITPFILEYKNDSIKKCIHVAANVEISTMQEAIDKILEFQAVMFLDGFNIAYAIDAKGWDKRTIEEPESEIVIRGSKEGFVETIRINTSMLRRKIKNPNLVFEALKLGRQTKTDVAIAYIDGIANKDILDELRKRLSLIDIDGVLESGYIEEYIEDSHVSPFSTIGNTQKPDRVAAKLLEGRIAILCDGTPHVLTVPYLFIEHLQSSEDYYMRPYIASFLRALRIFAFFVSVFLPALYVALQTFHQEMIPTTLLIRMAAAKEGLPFPTAAEAFFMILMFELLRESGTRLPRQVGSAVSIVGALVIGEAAVNAGIVSGTMVIVTSITAICSFIVSSLSEVMVIYRLVFLFLGGFMGLYGIACGIAVTVAHAVSIKTFGVPYMFPLAPFNIEGMKDYEIRFPLFKMIKRPKFIVNKNIKRRRK